MNRKAIVFGIANHIPKIMPEEVAPYVKIIFTRGSDYPDHINNVLAFPGIFPGSLDFQTSDISEEKKLAAAYDLANPNMDFLTDEKEKI